MSIEEWGSQQSGNTISHLCVRFDHVDKMITLYLKDVHLLYSKYFMGEGGTTFFADCETRYNNIAC